LTVTKCRFHQGRKVIEQLHAFLAAVIIIGDYKIITKIMIKHFFTTFDSPSVANALEFFTASRLLLWLMRK
jgi:hypothetical protein